MNVHTFTIPVDICETRLFSLARRMLPELPEYALREAFANKDVKMNGKRVPKDALALPGAEVRLYTPHGEREAMIPLIYQDEAIVVVRKPQGVSCQEDAKGGKTISNMTEGVLRRQCGEDVHLFPCHRLDNQTEGLLLLAKTEEAHQVLVEAFRKRQIHKQYICLVKGTPQPSQDTLSAYLQKDAKRARVRICQQDEPGSRPILTEYRVLEPGETSRVQVWLHTGRTHQIRAHMAAIGHPLLGDDLYGDRAWNKAHKAHRLMLCATGLSFALTEEMTYLNTYTFRTEPSF